MARKPMITRTIESTQVTAICLDTVTVEPSNKTFNITGTYKDDKKLLKALQTAYDTEDFKVVKIVDKQVVETLYGMDANFFLDHAVRLDPQSRKPIEDDVTDIVDGDAVTE